MTTKNTTAFRMMMSEVEDERRRQEAKFPDQHLPDGTDSVYYGPFMREAQNDTDLASVDGSLTWNHVLREEVLEAFAAPDLANLREELIQVAGVAIRWIEDIDSRGK